MAGKTGTGQPIAHSVGHLSQEATALPGERDCGARSLPRRRHSGCTHQTSSHGDRAAFSGCAEDALRCGSVLGSSANTVGLVRLRDALSTSDLRKASTTASQPPRLCYLYARQRRCLPSKLHGGASQVHASRPSLDDADLVVRMVAQGRVGVVPVMVRERPFPARSLRFASKSLRKQLVPGGSDNIPPLRWCGSLGSHRVAMMRDDTNTSRASGFAK